MDFRWVAFITLWTFLSGPILAQPPQPPTAARKPAAASCAKSPRPHSSESSRR